MPEGFEVSESVNAVVSVRRRRKDGAQVLDVWRWCARRCRGSATCGTASSRADGKAIVIYEPYPRREQLEGGTSGSGGGFLPRTSRTG